MNMNMNIFNRKKTLSMDADISDDDGTPSNEVSILDKRPLEEANALLADLDEFLEKADKTISFTKKATKAKHAIYNPLKVTDKFNQWRAKRKGNELHYEYTTLLNRCDGTEKQLKFVTDQALSDSATMILQAVRLKIRLKACIHHNDAIVSQFRPFMNALEALHKNLELQKYEVLDMITFVDEVTKLKTNEPFIPWALRNTDGRDITVIPFKRETLEKRLRKIDKVCRFYI
jgi:hypothetical protein